MENAGDDRYTPPDHFKKLGKFQSLVDEACEENTEIWLVQIPANELGPDDLLGKQWRMHTNPPDGKLGRFFDSRGDSVDVIKQEELGGAKTYAFVPISATDSFAVRGISHRVSFVRGAETDAGDLDDERKSGSKKKKSRKALQ